MMDTLLSIQNFYFNLHVAGGILPILQNINFAIHKKEILSLVGESGCGKTVCSLAITKLLPDKRSEYQSGKILFHNENLLEADPPEMAHIRGNKISYVFQDPFSSLNPLKKIKEQILEPFLIHVSTNEKEGIEKAKFLMDKVGLSDLSQRLNSYPNQLSGGILQRVCIAMALMCDPELLIADEPTSALDVTVQAQLVDLFHDLREERGMSILFISHDLSLVSSISDRIAVMYAGEIVEEAVVEDIIHHPKHPYTKALLGTIPALHTDNDSVLQTIPGVVPTPDKYPQGCHFSARCSEAMERCEVEKPLDYTDKKMHKTRCFLYEGYHDSN
ncbi:MAG: ABC transporter ATP-binding protein [Spirochaetota bacterium]